MNQATREGPGATPPDAEQSCSTIEAAQQLGTSVQTVQRWMDRGYLRGWRTPGGHRRVEVASVRALLERSRATPAAAAPLPSSAGAARVMLVDDSPNDLELLAAVAGAAMPGAEFSQFNNAFAALMAIGQQPPDLLIADISMPGLDGVEMIRSLQDNPRTAHVPVIAVSSYDAGEIAARYGELPAGVKLFAKPVMPSMLKTAVGEIAPRLVAAR